MPRVRPPERLHNARRATVTASKLAHAARYRLNSARNFSSSLACVAPSACSACCVSRRRELRSI